MHSKNIITFTRATEAVAGHAVWKCVYQLHCSAKVFLKVGKFYVSIYNSVAETVNGINVDIFRKCL